MKKPPPYRNRESLTFWFALLLLVMIQPSPTLAEEFRMSLLFDGKWSECYEEDPSLFRTIAGGMADLSIAFMSVNKHQSEPNSYRATDPTWPKELTIEVTGIGPNGDTVRSDVIEPQLQMRFYHTRIRVLLDSVQQAGALKKESDIILPRYNISFYLPTELAGFRLQFKVRYADEDYGDLRASRDLEIVNPCSDIDTERMQDSYLCISAKEGDFERVIKYADALMDNGWHSQEGLMRAYQAAYSLQRYDKALHFLDNCYETHGSIAFPGKSDESDTLQNRERYERRRAATIELINGQQKH